MNLYLQQFGDFVVFSRWASFHGYGTTDPHAFDDLVTFGDRICSLTQSIPQLRTVYFFPRVSTPYSLIIIRFNNDKTYICIRQIHQKNPSTRQNHDIWSQQRFPFLSPRSTSRTSCTPRQTITPPHRSSLFHRGDDRIHRLLRGCTTS